MHKKYLNTFFLITQYLVSIVLGIYLIVPIYGPLKNKIQGDSIYSPYEGWEKSPLNVIHIEESYFIGTVPDSTLLISPFTGHDNVLILDSVSKNYLNPFLFGQSTNDIQFLLKKYDIGDKSIYSSRSTVEDSTFILDGISMQLVESQSDFDFIDKNLNNGIPLFALAGDQDSIFSFNLLMTSTPSVKESLFAIKEGRNLLAFSKNKNFLMDMEKIPVIRNIQWKNNTLKIDLSEKGTIRVISSGFKLDTLSNNLSLKLNNPKWFRFEVDFPEDEINYRSNPFYRYSTTPFSTSYPKAKNQLTIFINLSWLIVIILINILINRLRMKYL